VRVWTSQSRGPGKNIINMPRSLYPLPHLFLILRRQLPSVFHMYSSVSVCDKSSKKETERERRLSSSVSGID
jgi:hypothetical protein